MKKLLALLFSLCLLAGVTSTAFADDLNYDFKIGYTVLGNATNFFVSVNSSLEAACAEKGVELAWTINDRDASKMRTAIDTYVMQDADIIVDFTVLAETGTAIATELANQGIPLLSIDCVYENAYFFGVNNEMAGITAGEYVQEWVGSHWDDQIDAVQVLYNEANGATVKLRVSAAADVLTGAGLVDADKVTYTNINSSGASTTDVSYVRSLVVDYLTAHPNDKHIVIVAQTDEQANAANAAAMSSGREGEVAIISHNCDLSVVATLQQKAGAIIGTVNYNSSGYGAQIVDACAQILAAQAAGEKLDWFFYNKVFVVNQDNVWDYFPDAIQQ